jgi:hypothetical protein
MPDGQPAPATAQLHFDGRPLETLDELGLDPEDLEGFGDDAPGEVGELEDQQPVQEGEPATPADPATQPSPTAQPSAPAPTPEPGQPVAAAASPAPSGAPSTAQPAAAAPAAQVPAQPSAESPVAKPWTPTADGQRIEIEGATLNADGSLTVPAGGVPKLQSSLAYRPNISKRFEELQTKLRERDPARNEDVILARELIRRVADANGKGEDALWSFLQDFPATLQRLALNARNESLTHQLQLRDSREQSAQAEQVWQEMEPIVRSGLESTVDEMLAEPAFADLKGIRDRLTAQFWRDRATYIAVADQDYPQHGLVRGQPYVMLPQLRRAIEGSLELVQGARQGMVRDAAAARNAAVLTPAGRVPPVPAATSSQPTTRQADDGLGGERPKDIEEWRERMRRIANSPD